MFLRANTCSGSCVLKISVFKCQLLPFINTGLTITMDTWSTSQLILSQHLVDTWSIVGHVDWLRYLSTLNGMSAKISQILSKMLMKCQPRCWSSVGRGYQSRVLIDTWSEMPYVHMLWEMITMSCHQRQFIIRRLTLLKIATKPFPKGS